MGIRDDLRELAQSIRAIPGRDFECRMYTVERIESSWTGDYAGEGTRTETVTTITEGDSQPPRVRFLSPKEKAVAGLEGLIVEIGPITPEFPGGGYSWATLAGKDLAQGHVLHYRLTGPQFPAGALFSILSGGADRVFGHRLQLAPVSES